MATNFVNADAPSTSFTAPPPGESKPVAETTYFEGRFTARDLQDQVNRKWKEGSDRLQNFLTVGLECWHQYRNKQDFSDKEDWQARVTLAKAHSAVKQGVANIKRLLQQAGRYVLVEDPSGLNQFFAPYVAEGVHRIWETADFIETSSEAIECGLIMGLIAARQDWVFEEVFSIQPGIGADGTPAVFSGTVKEGRLKVQAIDPWRIRFGSETKPGNKIDWIIEERLVEIATLLQLGLSVPPELFKQDRRTEEREEKRQERTDEREPREQVQKRVRLREYWGPLIDKETQAIVVPQAHVIIANEEHVLVAEPNQLWRNRPPYVLASPLKVPFRFPGQGILEVNRELKRNIDIIAQLGTDYLKFSTLVMLEADMSALENPEDIATGAEPGKIFRKRPGSGAVEAIRQIPIHPLTGDVFNQMFALDKEYQRGTFIPEIVQGMLDVKGETTATEFAGTLQQTTVILSDIASSLERQYLEPMADMTWDLMLQFMDTSSNPNWEQLLGRGGALLDQVPRAERLELIQGSYQFRVRGISLQVEKMQRLGQLIQYLQTLGTINPALLSLLNMPEIFKRIHEAFIHDRPNELLAPNAQQLFPQVQQNLLLAESPSEQFAGKAGEQLIQGLIQSVLQANQPPAPGAK